MITSRHIQKVIWAAVLTAVLVLGILAAFSNQLSSGISLSYEEKLFDTDQVMTVNIRIDEDEWDDLLETAISETYYCCDIEINGETYYRVGIRAKGNTSLSMVASSALKGSTSQTMTLAPMPLARIAMPLPHQP